MAATINMQIKLIFFFFFFLPLHKGKEEEGAAESTQSAVRQSTRTDPGEVEVCHTDK